MPTDSSTAAREILDRDGEALGRYALYWAPPANSPFAVLGRSWLGRDTEGHVPSPRPAIDCFDQARLEALTAEPRRYGLHATLKPPFVLAEGSSPAALIEAIADFAATTSPLLLPMLRLRRIDRFLALTPSAPCPALDSLAARCVIEFDRFRRPPSPAALARRRAAGLSEKEEEYLLRWGYPYVLDRFRFHVTLTGPLEGAEAEGLMPPLADLFQSAIPMPILLLADLALFHESAPGAPFQLIERFPLRGTTMA
jgi:putative phosphonate metabolism protein